MTLDIILLVLLFLSALAGWRSGALSMLASVIVLVASLLIASALAAKVGLFLHWGPTWSWSVIGFFLTFIVLMILGGWVKNLFRPKHGLLRGIDGVFGALLGLVRGALILGILLAIVQLIHVLPEHITEHSHCYTLLLKLTSLFIAVLRPYLQITPAHAPAIIV